MMYEDDGWLEAAYEDRFYEDDLMAFREKELDEDEWAERSSDAYEFCDSCDADIAEGNGIWVDAIPWAITYKDAGESATLCASCLKALGWVVDFDGRVVDGEGDLDREGDPAFNGAW